MAKEELKNQKTETINYLNLEKHDRRWEGVVVIGVLSLHVFYRCYLTSIPLVAAGGEDMY